MTYRREKNKPLPRLEELKEYFDYNPDTGIITWKKTTNQRIKVGEEAGCLNVQTKNIVYRCIKFNHSGYKTHRLAYYMYHGIDPLEKLVDHEDGNGLNNKIKNLRLATTPENGRNRRLQKTNTSGITGVHWNKRRKKWEAHIKVNFKKKWLGYFVNKEDAIQARKEAEKKYFGEFRRKD
jgi:hypothetical protein